MLALDVDGTLAARGDEITPPTRDALHRLAGCGIEVVIATGRRYRSTRRVIEALGLPVRAVCLGGALVKEPDGTTHRSEPFSPDCVGRLAALARERGHAAVGQRDPGTSGGADFVVDAGVEWNAPTRSYFESNYAWAERDDGLADGRRDDVLVVGIFGEREALDVFARDLHLRHPERYVTTIVPGTQYQGWYCEIVQGHVNKWSALAAVATSSGVAHEHVCAVGDQLNDLAMIQGAGVGVAMANGHARIKAIADWVTGRHDEDGIVEVVQRILGR